MDKQPLYVVGDSIRFYNANGAAIVGLVDRIEFSEKFNQYLYTTVSGNQVLESEIG